jgi:uncharacterized protein (DUF433 family)
MIAMSPTAAPVLHICLDDQGRPWIDGTTMKVIELITGVVAYGWNAEDLSRQYPQLTPGQIHSALAYYFDHQAAMDAELDRISRDADVARAGSFDSPLRQRLRAMGKLG